MPKIRIALLWHMHQPFYRNPFTGKFELPWVRLHGLKDYFGMVHILKDFPKIRLTFNLVPALLSQLEDYIGGKADTFQEIFLKAAEALNDREIDFLIRHFFSAHYDHLIKPYPRYDELYHKRQQYPTDRYDWKGVFTAAELRDLQVWFPLCYFDEEYKQHDRQIKNLIDKGHHFSEQDKHILVDRERELLRKIIPEYKKFWEAGQIELSTSPFYHPILPLLLDPQQARLANPQLPEYDLRFNWKEDALGQLESALDYMERLFGRRPSGIWPSEGSLSAEVLALMEKMGVRWTAGDEMVLSRSLGIPMARNPQGVVQNPGVLYRPYTLDGHRIRIFFRDHHLSDLIGFSYQKPPSKEAAADLIHRLKAIPAADNGEAVVPIILDGENAWEYYKNSGRDFLREFYSLIEADDSLETVTFSDVPDVEPGVIARFVPGSWINGNFDTWMGHEEDRRAWQLLKETRDLVGAKQAVLEDRQREEVRRLLFIAQGSDWFWWYGRENYTPDLDIFDRLFRLNLQKVYEILGEEIPPPLSRPVPAAVGGEENSIEPPKNYISPGIDGKGGHYFEWLGAGRIDVAATGGAMQAAQPLIQSILYGFDRENLYIRLNTIQPARTYPGLGYALDLSLRNGDTVKIIVVDPENEEFDIAIGSVIEARVPLNSLSLREGDAMQLSLQWRLAGSPFRTIPRHGFFSLKIPPEKEYAHHWLV